jgi:hypothetical protein
MRHARLPASRALLPWLSLAAAGCHLLAGLDDYTIAEGGSGGGGAAPVGARPTLLFARAFGGALDDAAACVAAVPPAEEGAASEAAIGGPFRGAFPLDGLALASTGEDDAWVARVGATGDVSLAASFGAARVAPGYLETSQSAAVVAVDASGHLLVGGPFEGSLAPGGARTLVAPASADVAGTGTYLVKLDPAGRARWARSLGEGVTLGGIAIDSVGNVLVAGAFFGTIRLGDTTLTSAGNRDVLVAKLGPDGAPLWSRSYGDVYPQSATSIAIDPNTDAAVIAGDLLGEIDFGLGAPLVGTAGTHVFVAKLSPEGQPSFATAFGPNAGNPSVAVDGFSNLFLAGTFSERLDLGGGPLEVPAGGAGLFLAKLDLGGAHLSSRAFPGGVTPCDLQSCPRTDIHVATDGVNAILAGTFHESVDFGGGRLESAGAEDVFVAKFDKAGELVWSARVGEEGPQSASAVAAGPDGRVFVAGRFAGEVDFGAGPLVSAGGLDAFLAVLSP